MSVSGGKQPGTGANDTSQAPATRREWYDARVSALPRGTLRYNPSPSRRADLYTTLVLSLSVFDMAPSKTKSRAQPESPGIAWTTKWLVRLAWATAVWGIYKGLDAIKVSSYTVLRDPNVDDKAAGPVVRL